MNNFYVTTPIYYVNAKPHLGHAYTTIVADSLCRFNRLMGRPSYFLTGTDEHGDKIVQAAEKAGQTPREYVDEISGLFRDMWPRLDIHNDDFIRTTEARHIACVQDILQRVYDRGEIYFGEYGGFYCTGCERFYTEKELDNGVCPQHRAEPEYIAEKNYFFRMSNHQAWLLEHIRENPDFIRPQGYRNEVVSMLESGVLEDLCISRPKKRLSWGIDLPFDQNFVCYVWFDALINYVSALGGPEAELYKRFWPVAQHVVAKDILKPHAIFWPTMLHAAGLPVYQHLNVHGYWLVRDTKMSKSLGNVVGPLDMAQKYGLSAFRYFLLREMHFGGDSSFSEEALVGRLNADLANDLGNLFSRVLSMNAKYFQGVVPEAGQPDEAERELMTLARQSLQGFAEQYEQVKFSGALESLWELVRGVNRYIDACAPWTLYKNQDLKRLATVLYTALEAMRKTALCLWPVMPRAAETMLDELGWAFDPAKADLSGEIDTWGSLPSGLKISASSNLFPRVELASDEDKKPAKEAKPESKGKKAAPDKKIAEPAESVDITDFQKLDLRLGTILEAAKHPEADRLLCLKVDLAEAEPRQIVAGLAEHYRPEDLVGQQVVVLANLKPRELRGLISHGMVMAVKDANGLSVLTSQGQRTNGSRIS